MSQTDILVDRQQSAAFRSAFANRFSWDKVEAFNIVDPLGFAIGDDEDGTGSSFLPFKLSLQLQDLRNVMVGRALSPMGGF
jgi:hypothetical protein